MPFDVHRLVGLGRVTAFDRSPDWRWLAVEVGRADDRAARYRSALWRVPLDGGAPTRIGRGRFHDAAPRFSADGTLWFTSDRSRPDHGEEDEAPAEAWRQVWSWSPDTVLVRRTDEPLGVRAFRVAHTGRLCLLSPVLPGLDHARQRQVAEDRRQRGPSLRHYRDMPVRYWDHWLAPARVHLVRVDPDGTRIDLTPEADREYELDPSWDLAPDGSRLVITRTWTGALRIPLREIERFDLDTGARQRFGEGEGWSYYVVRLAPDGRRVATQRGRVDRNGLGRHHLHLVDLDTGEGRDVATDWDRWPVPQGWLDDRTVLCTADDQCAVPLFAVDLPSGRVRTLADQATHQAPVVAPDRIYAIRHALLEPPEVVSVPVGGGAPTWHTALAGIDRAELAELAVVEPTEVEATDGARVPLFTVRPAREEGPRPALLWIHGGPRGQWGQGWHWRWNPLVAVDAGYVVGLPNPRGSTGLGQAFVDGIWGNTWGEQCYRDVLAAADALVARPDVDPERTCAMGGSFGGYMTNWIGARTDRFTCLITHASIFSFHQFGWTTDLPAWWALDFGTTPWEDREAYERYSPDMQLPGWRSPTLVIHGEKDYRVPIGEALALFECLRQHGVEAELAVFPDENHWILKPRNVVAWYELVLDFLGRHLGPGGAR